MTCRYYKICKIASDKSLMCISGGGSYCGHYRTLSYIENKNKVKKKERNRLNKFLKDIKKNKKIIDKLLRGITAMEKLRDSAYSGIEWRIETIIMMATKKIEELST